MAHALASADDGRVFDTDLVVLAALNRSMGLVAGFAVLVDQNNALCAIPLLRMQVDNVLRTVACGLVVDPAPLVERILAGELLTKKPALKSRDGQLLTDKYLCERAAEKFAWVPEVYRRTSGHVHLSRAHLLGMISPADGGQTTLAVGGELHWSEDNRDEAVEAFVAATDALLRVCAGFLAAKERRR